MWAAMLQRFCLSKASLYSSCPSYMPSLPTLLSSKFLSPLSPLLSTLPAPPPPSRTHLVRWSQAGPCPQASSTPPSSEGSHFWHQSQLQWGPAARQQTSAHSLSTYRGFGERETNVSEDCTGLTILSCCTDSLCSYWQPQLTRICTITHFNSNLLLVKYMGYCMTWKLYMDMHTYVLANKHAVLRTGELSVLHIPTHVVDVLI